MVFTLNFIENIQLVFSGKPIEAVVNDVTHINRDPLPGKIKVKWSLRKPLRNKAFNTSYNVSIFNER